MELENKYKTILIDPPWPVDFKSPLGQGRKEQYPTMTLEEIRILPIKDIASEDCGLWVWTTHTFLPITFDLISGWGFKFHIQITWDKGSGLTCFGFHRRTEMCLYAYRGKMNLKNKEDGQAMPSILRDVPDLFYEQATKHSKKPEIFYRYLEANTPSPRIELFARNKRHGWDVWGNEVECDINLGLGAVAI